MKAFVMIDNGHGCDTPGKCSPDGRYREWRWTRDVASLLEAELERRGIASELLVPEECDVALVERCRCANMLYRRYPEAVLVSLHSNASGDGRQWGTASGWSAWVAQGASTGARRLARLLSEEAIGRGLGGNRHTPPCGYHEGRFYICRHTRCPAVLTENMFHDHKDDVEFLLSGKGMASVAALHADALERYYVG